MTPRQWMLAAVGRLQERGDHDLARQLADAERCATELLYAATGVASGKPNLRELDRLHKAIANMERAKG